MRIKGYFIIILSLLLLTGCQLKEMFIQTEEEPEDAYHIYKVEGGKLTSTLYETETEDCDELVSELLSAMGIYGSNVMQEAGIKVESKSINNQVCYLSFNNDYLKLSGIDEVLFRASIVKTITQVSDITHCFFYVNGLALTYENGEGVGKMAATDFVEESDEKLNSLAWTTLNLYFSDLYGEKLIEKKIDVAYSKTMPLEKIIVEQLITGPQKEDKDMRSTLPGNLKVLGITIKDEVCYVNLDSVFLTDIVDVSANVQIYSIVNSLCNLPNIKSVRFQVNGDNHVSLRDVSLERTFEKNNDLILETEEIKSN